jgi:hypothetical protein
MRTDYIKDSLSLLGPESLSSLKIGLYTIVIVASVLIVKYLKSSLNCTHKNKFKLRRGRCSEIENIINLY